MKYRCRTVKPRISEWFEVEEETPELAAAEFHFQKDGVVEALAYIVETGPHQQHVVKFVRVEVEGHGAWVSRVYHYGIFRRGGVKPWYPQDRLRQIAQELDWMHKPEDLLEEGWEGEESMEDARARG